MLVIIAVFLDGIDGALHQKMKLLGRGGKWYWIKIESYIET
jgi:hypothetical protein